VDTDVLPRYPQENRALNNPDFLFERENIDTTKIIDSTRTPIAAAQTQIFSTPLTPQQIYGEAWSVIEFRLLTYSCSSPANTIRSLLPCSLWQVHPQDRKRGRSFSGGSSEAFRIRVFGSAREAWKERKSKIWFGDGRLHTIAREWDRESPQRNYRKL